MPCSGGNLSIHVPGVSTSTIYNVHKRVARTNFDIYVFVTEQLSHFCVLTHCYRCDVIKLKLYNRLGLIAKTYEIKLLSLKSCLFRLLDEETLIWHLNSIMWSSEQWCFVTVWGVYH